MVIGEPGIVSVCPEESVVVEGTEPAVIVIVLPELSVVVTVGGEATVTVEPALFVVVIIPDVCVPDLDELWEVDDTPPAGEPGVELGALLLIQLLDPDPMAMTSVLPPLPRPGWMMR